MTINLVRCLRVQRNGKLVTMRPRQQRDGQSSNSSSLIQRESYTASKMASFIRGAHPQLQMTTGWQHRPIIGTAGWNDFQFLFFLSNGTLCGVCKDKFYTGSTPTQSIDAHTWLASSTVIGSSGWSQFKFLMSPLYHK